jgi:hypothetical protein
VWFNNEFRLKGIVEEIKNINTNREFAVVFCFFEKTAENLSDLLKKENIEFISSEAGCGNSVRLMTVKNISQFGGIGFLTSENPEKNIRLIAAEHYPVESEEKILLDKLAEITDQKITVSFHNSFDDPILKIFGSDNIKKMAQTLGLKTDECISHGMINKSIKNAQKKLSEKVRIEQKADSPEKWTELNFGNQ